MSPTAYLSLCYSFHCLLFYSNCCICHNRASSSSDIKNIKMNYKIKITCPACPESNYQNHPSVTCRVMHSKIYIPSYAYSYHLFSPYRREIGGKFLNHTFKIWDSGTETPLTSSYKY